MKTKIIQRTVKNKYSNNIETVTSELRISDIPIKKSNEYLLILNLISNNVISEDVLFEGDIETKYKTGEKVYINSLERHYVISEVLRDTDDGFVYYVEDNIINAEECLGEYIKEINDSLLKTMKEKSESESRYSEIRHKCQRLTTELISTKDSLKTSNALVYALRFGLIISMILWAIR